MLKGRANGAKCGTATKEKQEGKAQEARGEGEEGRSEKWFEKVCELDKIRRGVIMRRGVRGWKREMIW